MIIGGFACGATVGYNYIHGEIWDEYKRFEERSRRRAPRAISATTSSAAASLPAHASHGYGAYICGEETALLESSRGRRVSRATSRRSRPPTGLYGKPTTINNTRPSARCPRSS
jgi:NADH-quinone oxidoreductase subunit F